MTRIIPLRTGWGPNPDDPPYYPDELPQDWRLAYFANAFWGVLVPQPLWSAAGAAGVSAWAEETPARFRIYLDLRTSASPPMLAVVLQSLGERLGGLVVRGTAPGAGVDMGAAHLRRVVTVRRVAGVVDGLAHDVPPALIRDLGAARRWIEERVYGSGAPSAGEPAVALLGECGFADLERWQSLVELMGLA